MITVISTDRILIQKPAIRVSSANTTSSPISILSRVAERSVNAEEISMAVLPVITPAYVLAHIEYRHCDRKCVTHQIYSDPHFYEVLEKHPGINIMHVVALGQHRNQFVAEYECDNNTCDRHDHGIR